VSVIASKLFPRFDMPARRAHFRMIATRCDDQIDGLRSDLPVAFQGDLIVCAVVANCRPRFATTTRLLRSISESSIAMMSLAVSSRTIGPRSFHATQCCDDPQGL
jgi:hypothetical protein